jgi:lactoylglutathione lyase
MNPDTPELSSNTASLVGTGLAASLTVKDVHASMAFYRDALGFTVGQQHEREGKLRAASMAAGEVRILLNQDDGAKGSDRVKGDGMSLQITTRQNIDAIAQRVKAAGGSLESDPFDAPWGVRVFRLKDPDGFKLVISSEKPATPSTNS